MKAITTLGRTQTKEPPWLALMASIVTQAVKDFHSRDWMTALDALLWLTSDEALTFLDALNMEDLNPWKMITQPPQKNWR